MDVYKQRDDFLNTSKVIADNSEIIRRSTFVTDYFEDEGIILNNDETKEVVTRQVEGKLADDVRKRVKAAPDASVFITEAYGTYWLSELTADNYYQMTIKCNDIEKTFELLSAIGNFQALLEWLDEVPSAPVGEDVF